MIRTYSQLRRLQTFNERYEYLRLGGRVGASTFGVDRYLNQMLYTSDEWRSLRNDIIIRDEGNDLGVFGFEIVDKIIIHHMNPITREDIINYNPEVFDPRFLICVSFNTHQAIHYGDERLLPQLPVERRRNDTIPWRL